MGERKEKHLWVHMEGATDRKGARSGTPEKLWTHRYWEQLGYISHRSKACSIKEKLLITSSLCLGLTGCWLIVLVKRSLNVCQLHQLSMRVLLQEMEAEMHKQPVQGHTVHLHHQWDPNSHLLAQGNTASYCLSLEIDRKLGLEEKDNSNRQYFIQNSRKDYTFKIRKKKEWLQDIWVLEIFKHNFKSVHPK